MARGKAGAGNTTKRQNDKGGWRRVLLGILVLLAVLLVPVGMLAWNWWQLQQPYKGYTGEEKIVEVEPGTSASQIIERLEQEGVLADAGGARFYLVYFLDDASIRAGEYLFRGPLTTPQVLKMLTRGQVVNHSITLVEGLTLEETADQLAKAGFGRRETFIELMRSPALIADFDPQAPDLEGYLFPETYSFSRGVDERTIVQTLVKTFRKQFDEKVKPQIVPGQTPRQLVTLASIVEKEAQVSSERPVIAAVYRNRTNIGMGLGADPTVIYALKRLGRWNGNIRKDDLRVDSPYNTYRYAGLPPGPICSPGLASLAAAADPADVPYLYFVSRNDGTHVFARSLSEHNRNVEQWQRRYWREKRAQERREGQGGPGR